MPNRRSLWPLTWLPSPSTKRPFEFAWRSQAWRAIGSNVKTRIPSTPRSVPELLKRGEVPLFSPSPPFVPALSGAPASRFDRRPEPFFLLLELGGHRLKIRGFENLADFDLGLAP